MTEPTTEPTPEPELEPELDDETGGEDDTGADEAGEPEQGPETLSEKQAEQIIAALEREAARHAREVEKRAGPMFADLVPCPACTQGHGTAGFIVPVLPEPYQALRREAVRVALGGDDAPDYPVDPDKDTCDVCHGYGKLRTGSLVENQTALPCRACTGQGWRQKLAPAPAPASPLAWQAQTSGAAAMPAPASPTDPWGRPLGHPHFNIAPAEAGT